MRKLVFFLLLILNWSIVNGQLFPPIQPYNESGYTVLDFEMFARNLETDKAIKTKNAELSASYKRELLSIVNDFLQSTGLNKNFNNGAPLGEEWISWIFCPIRTSIEHRVYLGGFWNSHQSTDGKTVVFYWDSKRFEGMIVTLHLDGYELDLGKTCCMNLVKVPFVKKWDKPVVEKTPEVTPSPVPQTNSTPQNITIVINNYNGRSNEDYGNNQGYMVSDIVRERMEMLGYSYVPVYSFPVRYAFGSGNCRNSYGSNRQNYYNRTGTRTYSCNTNRVVNSRGTNYSRNCTVNSRFGNYPRSNGGGSRPGGGSSNGGSHHR